MYFKHVSRLSIAFFVAIANINQAHADEWFNSQAIPSSTYHLFDIGVAKIDSDDYLDIFTSNHSDLQGAFLGGDALNFTTNQVTRLGLNQDLNFPGLESRRNNPPSTQSGIYVYWKYGQFVVESNVDTPLEGEVSFPSTVESYWNSASASASVSTEPTETGGIRSIVSFEFESNGQLTIEPGHVGVPFDVSLSPSIAVDDIFVGWRRVQPDSHDFQTSLLDRHGYAWADIDGNGEQDVLITRGGLHGDIDKFPPSVNDELLLQTQSEFSNLATEKGIYKLDGRGRQVAWADANSDGLLDLYVGNYKSANLLFTQNADGTFEERAAKYGLDIWDTGSFVWLDVDQDNDMDLLIKDNDSRETILFRNATSGSFIKEVLTSNNKISLIHWSVADIDRDGDIDAYMASTRESVLFINNSGDFQPTDPDVYGLPDTGISAQFVDFNNDSRVDLHVTPNGLYQQSTHGHFYKTSYLNDIYPAATNRAWNIWFDADIDGNQDLLTSYRLPIRIGADSKRYNSNFYFNDGSTKNWLQIDLKGPVGNANAIGARVELLQSNISKKYVQYVGSSEGSHYSQGNYRLHFGLNNMRRVKGLKVFWPDGSVQSVPALAINQLLEIEYNPD